MHEDDASLDDFALHFSKWPLSLSFRKPFDFTHGGFNTYTWFAKPSISSAILCSTTSFSSKFAFEPNLDDPLSIFSSSPNSIFLQMLLRLLFPWLLDMIVLAIHYLGLFSIATWMIILFISHHPFLSLLCPTFQNVLAWNFSQKF